MAAPQAQAVLCPSTPTTTSATAARSFDVPMDQYSYSNVEGTLLRVQAAMGRTFNGTTHCFAISTVAQTHFIGVRRNYPHEV